MCWARSPLSDKLTICMFARDLVNLYYPFIESIISTVELGCEYLVIDAGTDNTGDILSQMGKYLPIRVFKTDWPLDTEPGYKAAAMGICTQRLFAECPTDFGLNLQASEVYNQDAISELLTTLPDDIGPSMFQFRHFYGTMHRGGHGYHGYSNAPRLFKKGTQFDKTDACHPNNYVHGDCKDVPGFVNRYSYCWLNTIRAKAINRLALYDDAPQQTEVDYIAFHNSGKDPDNMIYDRSDHPICVRHLIDLDNYDVEFSLDVFKKWMST